MSETPHVELLVDQARKKESEFDWLGAVEIFRKALPLVPATDSAKRGELCEKSGYALFRAGMQAEDPENLRATCRRAIEEYQTARNFYGNQNGLGQLARALRCDAMIPYLGFWIAGTLVEKKRLLGEACRAGAVSLKKFDENQDAYEFWRTYRDISQALQIRAAYEELFQTRREAILEALELGEQAIRLLSTTTFQENLTEAYVMVSTLLDWVGNLFLQDREEQQNYRQKARFYWTKARELSENIALLAAALWGAGGFVDGSDEAVRVLKKGVEHAKKTGDHFIIGGGLELLAYHVFWKAFSVEDPDERKILLGEFVTHLEEAKTNYHKILFTSSGLAEIWSEAPYSLYYSQLAPLETDQMKKRHLLQKSVQAATDGLETARDSGYPYTLQFSHHVLSKSLAALAKVEPRAETRRNLLEKALETRNIAIAMAKGLEPYFYQNEGVHQNYLAEIRFELAQLEDNAEKKNTLLDDAVLSKKNCLVLWTKELPWIERIESRGDMAWFAERQFEYGRLLEYSQRLTGETDTLRESAKAFEMAAEWFQKAGMPTRTSESWWKTAQALDAMGENLRAAQAFEKASNNYKIAAEKIPRLGTLYKELVFYMDAWTEIEQARAHHAREEYGLAKDCYEKAASIHESNKHWSYLAPNYSAWAQVENAEDLSKKELGGESAQAFEHASQLFQKGKESIQIEQSQIQNAEEKRMAEMLVKVAEQRRQYCGARIILEKARLLEKNGDHYGSADNYERASEAFERLAHAAESEENRREFELIGTLSSAWRMMARAEDETSPEFYGEASKLFEMAKELSRSERARSIVLGHSRFCKALEAGTRFTDTGDPSLHSTATQQLESASKFYLKADFKTGADYSNATQLLFDAFALSDRAKKEEDEEKKTKLYMMTEKELQAAADAFLTAQQPAKREQVLKLLDKTKGELKQVLSLSEVLYGSSIVSTTATFEAPAAMREAAVGLEAFEHALVQARMIIENKEVMIGDDLTLEVELVNAGRGSAQLLKMEEMIPNGFKVKERPDPYRVEGSHINLRGKRLDPLKSEDLRLHLNPRTRGSFTFKPRIFYLDENGKNKSCELEPMQVIVKEPGLKGWLGGPQ